MLNNVNMFLILFQLTKYSAIHYEDVLQNEKQNVLILSNSLTVFSLCG